jgi:hypothetical protein
MVIIHDVTTLPVVGQPEIGVQGSRETFGGDVDRRV